MQLKIFALEIVAVLALRALGEWRETVDKK